MTPFDNFWADPRIPPEMKRCGKPRVRKALAKTGADPEQVLASLPGYVESLPEWQHFCHLSTYINDRRHEVDHAETGNFPGKDMTFDERREYGRRLVADKLRVVK